MIIDPRKQSYQDNYKLMIGSIIPRPIAFISTRSPEGIANLAPYSFFSGVTSNPPTICFAPSRKSPDGSKKDTLINIEATGEFVVNMVSTAFVRQMNETAMDFPYEVSEFAEAGLTEASAGLVKAPRVAESKINLECRLMQIVEIGPAEPGGGFLVIGEIILFHIADEIINNGRIDSSLLDPVGRLGGLEYCRLGERFALPRKPYQAKDKSARE